MPPIGLLRLKVMAVRVLGVEEAILNSELTILNLFVTERSFTHCIAPSWINPPPRYAQQKALWTLISPGLIGGEIRDLSWFSIALTMCTEDSNRNA